MYTSKYYTCPEIDQRLLQGYYDDAVHHGFIGTIDDFWKFILSIRECIKLTPDSVATQNNFSNELKAKLDSIEFGARRITQMSQLDNNTHYQNELQVRNIINPLISEVNTRISDIYIKLAAIDHKLEELSSTVKELKADSDLTPIRESIKELSKKIDSNESKINAIQPISETMVKNALTDLDY